ncbi:MFS transporter [Phenylobacterium montanum]|uniref:MFS transporter n=1 Tax=Phenylobacterium montanum TaxID=2823693 RepID=A0A975G041_9CAUL|nr:MFS transporter [Caulobacter sp. S6]QUD88640.1 MFS transporter [Caulobacter sp. S6]
MSERAPFDVNSRSAVASAVFLGTLGVISFIVQPGIVQGFVSSLHMSEARANDMVGIEMMGVALATILTAAIGERIDWRRLLASALIIGVVGDLASAFATNGALLPAARFVAGVGHGAVISLSFTFVGLTVRPDRNIAFYLVALLSYGAVGLWALPSLLARFGFQPVFLFFAAVTAIGLVTVPYVPRSSQHREEISPTAVQLGARVIVVGLAGVLAYNIAQGIAWANLALIGGAARLADQTVADDLFLSQLIAVAGALLSVALAGMGRRALMIAVGVAGGALFIALLTGQPGALLFLVAVCGFNFLWNFVLPFILSAVGDLDLHGRVMGPAIAMQMIGLGLGPILSGRLIQGGGFLQVEMACIGFFALSLALLAGPLTAHRRMIAARDAVLA